MTTTSTETSLSNNSSTLGARHYSLVLSGPLVLSGSLVGTASIYPCSITRDLYLLRFTGLWWFPAIRNRWVAGTRVKKSRNEYEASDMRQLERELFKLYEGTDVRVVPDQATFQQEFSFSSEKSTSEPPLAPRGLVDESNAAKLVIDLGAEGKDLLIRVSDGRLVVEVTPRA